MSVEKKRAGAILSVKRVVSESLGGEVLEFTLHGEAKDGETIPVLDRLYFDPRKASAECRAHAEWHGWEQRLRDAAAKPRDQKTGKSATPAEKFAAVRKLAEHYLAGAKEWNLRSGAAAGTGRESDDKQMLKAALAIYLPRIGKERTPVQIHESVEAMDKGKVSALLAQSEIAGIVLQLREEKALEQEVDAEELLEGL